MPILLVIDDDLAIHDVLRRTFEEGDLAVHHAHSAAEGVREFSRLRPDVVILDLNLGQESGLQTFRQIHEIDSRTPVIFVTGEGTTATAIEATAMGAYEYLLKPLKLAELRSIVSRAFEVSRLMRTPARIPELEPGGQEADVLVGRCPGMQEVYKAIGRVARQDVTVLILGESGTGKELVARAIYQYGRRAAAPFLAINCAAIPETLLESELFGHEKGAFTGADRRRIGKFEQCHGGTIFLDEVGDMPPQTQTKLLRLIQAQRFERVGGQETIQTDVRLITATNCDLAALVASGRFRKDLYYRLNVYAIHLPPLRDRPEDIPLLADHFIRRFGRDLQKDIRGITPEALAVLRRHPWPGNVRELQSALKYALLQATGPLILPHDFPPALAGGDKPAETATSEITLGVADLEQFLQARLREGATNLDAEWRALTEGYFLSRVLRHTGGNMTHAARILGIDRGTLRTRIKSLGVSLQSLLGSDRTSPGEEVTS